MRITVWRTFISEIIPLLEAMANECMSSVEGKSEVELVVMVEIK